MILRSYRLKWDFGKYCTRYTQYKSKRKGQAMEIQQTEKGVLFNHIPKDDAKELGWNKGDEIKTYVDDGKLIITKRGVAQ
jgi:hypothetical protein